MSDEPALLGAIRANPDEDTPRLVYADWLQEHGDDERAEYIRLKCAVARTPKTDPAWAEMDRRAAALHVENERKWFGPLVHDFAGCEIDRGFVTELSSDLDVFRKHAGKMATFAPALRVARVWSVGADAKAALKLPLVQWVRELSMDRVEPGSLPALAKFDPPDTLAEFSLFTNSLRTADVLLPVLEAPVLTKPSRVGLTLDFLPELIGSTLSDEEERAVACGETRRVLARLDLPNLRGLGFWGLNQDLADYFSQWQGLSRLDTLLFYCAGLEDPEPPTVLASPLLGDIRRAEFDENQLGDRTVEALASSPKFASLKQLDLGENEIGNRGANALLDSPYLNNIEYLDLRRNAIGPRIWKRLQKRFGEALQEED